MLENLNEADHFRIRPLDARGKAARDQSLTDVLAVTRLDRMVVAVGTLTIDLTVLGLILSTMHQSTLGAMYMAAPTKVHPLWYSAHMPVHFFISAVAAGIGMVIVEGAISHRAFHHQVQITNDQFRNINIGLAKAGAVVLAVYFAVKVVGLAIENECALLGTSWGAWYLVEMLGFVLLPCILFAVGYRELNLVLTRIAAVFTVVGVVLNRFNITFVVFNWNVSTEARYHPNWMEIWVTIAFITFAVVVFKLIASYMPIMYEHPDWKGEH